jgi:hypothetical protein
LKGNEQIVDFLLSYGAKIQAFTALEKMLCTAQLELGQKNW